ncbi:MAG: hypothetical protein E6K97_01305 [Thaumarchaeota archaeon]|nr:MAG: hypothetical protein E6K97_01305 [Nitrososphaerota archaeon]
MTTFKLHYEIKTEKGTIALEDQENLSLSLALKIIRNSAVNTDTIASSWKITIERENRNDK